MRLKAHTERVGVKHKTTLSFSVICKSWRLFMTNYEGTVGITSISVDPLRYERSRDADKLSKYESDSLICGLVPVNSRVLDIGCGQGVLMDILKQARNSDIYGI